MLAPIVLFVYNRPELTLNTLKSLARNAEAQNSELFVFADGAKSNASEEVKARIAQVREVVQSKQWCQKVTLRAAETNQGLAKSVIAGVTEIVNRYGKIIVMEDDITVSPYFLRFMNDALNKYELDERVSSVGTWNYFCPPDVSQNHFFLRHPDSISWATYKRAWALFNPDGNDLLQKIKNRKLERYFNLEGAVNLTKMLEKQCEGKVDSWAVRWTASMILHGKLTLYPQYPLARHEGFVVGTNFSAGDNLYDEGLELCVHPMKIKDIPVVESTIAVQSYVKKHRKINNIFTKGITRIKEIFNKYNFLKI